MNGPLDGVRVLDCTRLLPCAYGTLLLAQLGAEVVKVEAPTGGDYGRQMVRSFAIANRGKRSISLDLKSPEGQELLMRLAGRFDVLVESFRPGVMAAFGLSPERMLERHPRLIFCSVTGYGQTGPYASRPGHDLNYMGIAAASKPTPGVQPRLLALPVADMSVGVWLVGCIAAALRQRDTEGRGQYIDLSMTDIVFSMNLIATAKGRTADPYVAHDANVGDKLGGYPWPDLVLGDMPSYGVFDTADDQQITLCNIEGKFWRTFVDAIGRPELADDKFSSGARGEYVRAEVEAEIAKHPLAHWELLFEGRDVCFARINTADDASSDPHLLERGVMSWDGTNPVVGLPARFSSSERTMASPSPELGEANQAVFEELGLNNTNLDALRRKGVV